MQNPGNAYHLNASKPPSQRYVGIAFVGALHIALIYALLHGLGMTIIQHIPTVTEAQVLKPETTKPPETPPKPVDPVMAQPTVDTMPVPRIDIVTRPANPVHVKPATGAPMPADRAAHALGNTHSVPPYPPMARRLAHQGRVMLRLSISAQGRVVRAEIVTSSGWPELDAQAVDWVKAHWRYSPALRGGVAVASQAMAAVKFDLKSLR